MNKMIKVKADFSGGLDLVFDGKSEINLQVDQGSTTANLIKVLAQKHANNKKQMFYLSQKIRPDWQLTQKQDYVLQSKDKISFISTLHGG